MKHVNITITARREEPYRLADHIRVLRVLFFAVQEVEVDVAPHVDARARYDHSTRLDIEESAAGSEPEVNVLAEEYGGTDIIDRTIAISPRTHSCDSRTKKSRLGEP